MNTRRKLVIRMANVRKINTRPQFGSPVFRAAASGHSGLRVAAYARVSTDLEEQSSSFEAQKDYYERLINETPGWTFAGIYADRGISGTSTDHRAGFQAMMEDCRAGKIDRILTKSVSRFARNTVDSLNAIRELKSLGIGVDFQKENIFTLDSKGEFLITIMSSLSQEESRSISENVRWGIKKRMSDGKYSVTYSHFIGYDRGADGKMVINENEANIVRFIFRSRLQGYSDTATANRLMELGVPAPYGGEKWSPTVVRHMRSNEKMKGDALIQKSYVTDFLDKRQRKNKGEVQQYYVTGGHEAIIDPVLFDHVQEMIKRSIEDERGFSGVNPWSSRLVCGKCGNYFRVKHRHGKKCWECRDSYRKPDPCKNSYIYETAREWHVKELMKTALNKRPDVVKTMSEIIDRVVKDSERRERVKAAVTEIGRLPAEQLVSDDEDFLMTIKAIRFFPDYHIEVEQVDGSRMEMELKPCWPEKEKRKK